MCNKRFLCFYTNVLPWESVLRVWDMLYFDGIKTLFRIGLGILKIKQGKKRIILKKEYLLVSNSNDALDQIFHLSTKELYPSNLIKESLKFKVKRKYLENLRKVII